MNDMPYVAYHGTGEARHCSVEACAAPSKPNEARLKLGGARLKPNGARLKLNEARLKPNGARLKLNEARLKPSAAWLDIDGTLLDINYVRLNCGWYKVNSYCVLKNFKTMSTSLYWLPRGKKDLTLLAIKSVDYTSHNRDKLGMQATTDLGKWFDAFEAGSFSRLVTNYGRWENEATRTKQISDDMNDAVKAFIPDFREFHSLVLGNPLVKDSDLDGMGFPKRSSGGRSPAPVADVPPGYEVIPELGHRLRIDFFPIDKGHGHGKPAGQHGVEVKWGFTDAATDNPEQLPHSRFDTATPAILAFDSDDGGRKIYLALRWENTRGEKGPWSVVETILVP
jgi:hypothetical protein